MVEFMIKEVGAGAYPSVMTAGAHRQGRVAMTDRRPAARYTQQAWPLSSAVA